MQNNNDHMGGYVKYFTDMPATNGYPNTVVFPADDEMTVVCQGPFKGDGRPPADLWRGVKRMLTTPSYESAHFTQDYDPELAAKALAAVRQGHHRLRRHLSDVVRDGRLHHEEIPAVRDMSTPANWSTASRSSRAPEELELVKRAAIMQDGAMKAAFAAIKPGMRDTEVAAVAVHYSQDHGSENGIYLCASAPPGVAAKFGQRHVQNRTIQKGDTFALLVEDSGPGGMYTELGRSCVLGKVPQQMKDELEMVKQSRKLTLDMLKPGTPCKDIWEAFNDFMRKHGRPEEARLYCHGQGYDLVERPLIRSDEPWTIAEGHEHRRPSDLRLRRRSELAVRQLHHRRQRPRRPHPPFPRGDRRDRRLGRDLAAIAAVRRGTPQLSPPGLHPGVHLFCRVDRLPWQARQRRGEGRQRHPAARMRALSCSAG